MFLIFYRNTTVLESHFINVAGLQVCNYIKKRFQYRCFPAKFEQFLKTPILKKICEWLLLKWSNFLQFQFFLQNMHHYFRCRFFLCTFWMSCDSRCTLMRVHLVFVVLIFQTFCCLIFLCPCSEKMHPSPYFLE